MANACPHRCSVGFVFSVIVACIDVVLVVIVAVIVVAAFQ